MDEATGPAAYRIHVWIRGINPMIWRRLVVPSERTLADLHYAIQIAFAWTDYHLHRFRIRGKEYGIPRRGGPWYSRDARDLRLIDFHFRVNERFLYEYDFTDSWEHQVRIEQFVPPEQTQPWQACELVNQIAECVDKRDMTALRDHIDEIATMKEWLLLDKFDRRKVNRRLRQYAADDDEWRWQ